MKITEIEHFSHCHKLELNYSLTPYRCDGCKELGFGSCYQCKEEECDFHLHDKCAVADPFASHSFFKKSSFKFREKGKHSEYCVACGKNVQGFMYKSKKECVHPCCLKLPSTLNGDGKLTLNLKEKASSKCLICQHKEISKGKLKGWAYVSTCGKHCYHVGCANHMNYENWKMGYFNQHSGDRNSLGFITEENEESSSAGRNQSEGRWMRYALDLILTAILGGALESAAGSVLGL
ncbi:hypothetical protein DITRI_Ditri02bG0142200 [Diplodiscus trichospermus]